MKTLDKKTLLIVSASATRRETFKRETERHLSPTTIYEAQDGAMGLAKIKNAAPHIVITDLDLPKMSGLNFVEAILADRSLMNVALIIADLPPEKETFIDELASGRLQFLVNPPASDSFQSEFSRRLFRAFNYVSHTEKGEYCVRYLAKGEHLMKEGEKGDFVYFVKRGRLSAYKESDGEKRILGPIEVGEFVGEMAYINNEARSANVIALQDCELIEVPIGVFESLLYKRPSWSRALMLTLSKRVKLANQFKTQS